MDRAEEHGNTGRDAAVGAAAGIAASLLNASTPVLRTQIANLSAHGGRAATDAFRASVRGGSGLVSATGAGLTAARTVAAGGIAIAAAAIADAAIVLVPIAVGAVVVSAVGYGLYRMARSKPSKRRLRH